MSWQVTHSCQLLCTLFEWIFKIIQYWSALYTFETCDKHRRKECSTYDYYCDFQAWSQKVRTPHTVRQEFSLLERGDWRLQLMKGRITTRGSIIQPILCWHLVFCYELNHPLVSLFTNYIHNVILCEGPRPRLMLMGLNKVYLWFQWLCQ